VNIKIVTSFKMHTNVSAWLSYVNVKFEFMTALYECIFLSKYVSVVHM
jgi:hypothetical protein